MQTAVTAVSASGKNRGLHIAVAILSIAGVADSSISLYHHFSKSKTSFCDLGQAFNCDLVNRSSYSNVFGLPVALIGILGYLAVLALATIYREKAETPFILAASTLLGLCFSLRLTYIEAFVLSTWCILCLSSLAIILALTVLSGVIAARALREN